MTILQIILIKWFFGSGWSDNILLINAYGDDVILFVLKNSSVGGNKGIIPNIVVFLHIFY